MTQSTQCVECVHYLGLMTCSAFGEDKLIPEAIFTGVHDHREPYNGDNGVGFESITGEPALDDEDDDEDSSS